MHRRRSRRETRVHEMLAPAVAAAATATEEAVKKMPDVTLGDFLHEITGAGPSEIVVHGTFRNQRGSTPEATFELRCHVCQELLLQQTVLGLPVFSQRIDGSRYPCIVPICGEADCLDRLVKKVHQGDGP